MTERSDGHSVDDQLMELQMDVKIKGNEHNWSQRERRNSQEVRRPRKRKKALGKFLFIKYQKQKLRKPGDEITKKRDYQDVRIYSKGVFYRVELNISFKCE